MLVAASTGARRPGRRSDASASGKLIARPSTSAVTLTSTWLPR